MATKVATKAAGEDKDSPTIKVRGKIYTLFRRGEYPSSPWWYRLQVQGKRTPLSTSTSDLTLAKQRAKVGITDVLDGRWKRAEVHRTARKHVPTVGQIIDAAETGHQTARASTITEYKNGLLLVMRTALEITNEEARKLKIDVLTGPLARKWQAKMQKLERAEAKTLKDGNTAANSKLRFARSLFSRERILHYKEAHGYEMPASLQSFLTVPYLDEESHKYSDNPIPQAALDKMDKELPKLKQQDERLWAINLMVRLMGMRDIEIENSQTTWLSVHGRGKNETMQMRIIKRSGERAPKRTEGVVAVPAELVPFFKKRLAEAAKVKEALPLIAARHGSERHDLIYRDHNAFVRRFIPDREKAAHELRKHFGAIWVTKTGSLYEAAQRLRVTLAVAEYHYSALLKRPEALSLMDYRSKD